MRIFLRFLDPCTITFVDRKGARMEGAVVRLRGVSLLLENL